DMEAGVEHLGRGTIAGVDHLLIVVIPSKSSVRTALKIKKLAHDSGIPKISFVANLVQDDDDIDFLQKALGEAPVASFPDSTVIRKAERSGKPLTELAEEISGAPEELVRFLQGENN
ncbi:MAG: carbon monoxide dehydrogenase, partial [Nitrospira bacterium SG8_35_1]